MIHGHVKLESQWQFERLDARRVLIDGILIVVGGSHPGIDTIVEAATGINPRIPFIAGGRGRRADV